ncbi:MAG: SDR family NAD(P)-dependent oxidoreductase [Alphaproteobacteria bacterium]
MKKTYHPPYEGALAWVTGASSGIGEALCLALAAHGWRVVATARNIEGLNKLAATGGGDKIFPIAADVTDEPALNAAYQEIESRWGSPYLVVFNAGGYVPDAAENFDPALLEWHLKLNVTAVAYGLKLVMPSMIAKRIGHIAVVASVAGYRGLPKAASYCASKAAAIALMESLYFNLTPLGVKTQIICPGFVKTPLTDKNDFPMPFMISAQQAANYMMAGLASRQFHIAFPLPFVQMLQFLRILPYSLYFKLVNKKTGI